MTGKCAEASSQDVQRMGFRNERGPGGQEVPKEITSGKFPEVKNLRWNSPLVPHVKTRVCPFLEQHPKKNKVFLSEKSTGPHPRMGNKRQD